MEKLSKSYDVEKLRELKNRIQEKESEILNDINHALGNKDVESYNNLKQLQLQCKAELRLIEYIENGMEDEFMIC